jgi:hypothetical protein
MGAKRAHSLVCLSVRPRSSVAAYPSASFPPPRARQAAAPCPSPIAGRAVLPRSPTPLASSLSVRCPSPSGAPLTPPWPLGRTWKSYLSPADPRPPTSVAGAGGARTLSDSTPMIGFDRPRPFPPLCCKCTFQIFQGYVAYVAYFCKCLQWYVARVLKKCCICFRRMLQQVFYLNVAYVLHTCCKCFIWVLHMFSYTCCKCFI